MNDINGPLIFNRAAMGIFMQEDGADLQHSQAFQSGHDRVG
jgi:hypothetical protein